MRSMPAKPVMTTSDDSDGNAEVLHYSFRLSLHPDPALCKAIDYDHAATSTSQPSHVVRDDRLT